MVGLAEHPTIIQFAVPKLLTLRVTCWTSRCPLAASWTEVSGFTFIDGALEVKTFGTITSLLDASQFIGYTGPADLPNSIIMKKMVCIWKLSLMQMVIGSG